MKRRDFIKNLAADPQHAEIKQALGQKLDQWIKDHEDPFYSLKATSRAGVELDGPRVSP